jgi:hypothetical protein
MVSSFLSLSITFSVALKSGAESLEIARPQKTPTQVTETTTLNYRAHLGPKVSLERPHQQPPR